MYSSTKDGKRKRKGKIKRDSYIDPLLPVLARPYFLLSFSPFLPPFLPPFLARLNPPALHCAVHSTVRYSTHGRIGTVQYRHIRGKVVP